MYIDFTSLKGAQYRLQIGNTLGDELVGSVSPFVINEDNSEDMFKAVRLQSGYIRIVTDSENDWQNLIPLTAVSTPVRLSGGATWLGFLSTGTYGTQYHTSPKEVELPVVCPLTVLSCYKSITPPNGNNYTPTFGELIDYIMEDISIAFGQTFSYSILPDSQDFNDLLSIQVQWGALLEYDEDGNLVRKQDDLQLLESICTTLGLTCRTYGGAAYFTAADQQQTSIETISFASFPFADASSMEKMMEGVRDCTVKSSISIIDNFVDVPFEKIVDDNLPMDVSGITQTPYGTNGKTFVINSVEQEPVYEDVSVEIIGSQEIVVSGYIDDEPQQFQILEDIDWEAMIKVNRSPQAGGMILSSRKQYTFNGGRITIGGNMMRENINNGEMQKIAASNIGLECSLIVGGMMWQPISGKTGQWVSAPSDLTQNVATFWLSSNGGQLYYRDIYLDADAAVHIDKSGIPVRTLLSGEVKLIIYGHNDQANNPWYITDIRVTYSRGRYRNKSSQRFVSAASNVFTEKRAINVDFASDGQRMGYGLELLTNANPNVLPEQMLADRIAAFYDKPRRFLDLHLLADGQSTAISPESEVEDPDGDTFTPLSISYDYWNDIVNVKLLQTN